METFATGLKKIKTLCDDAGVNDTIKGENDIINGNHDEAVMSCIKNIEHVTIGQIVEKTGLSRSTVARIIKRLKESGRIERKGSRKKGYWEVCAYTE